jgi:hypothetical protein
MQQIILTISLLSTRFVVNGEDTCGEYLLPNAPVHFKPEHQSQWRLLALSGQKQDGEIINGVRGEPAFPTVIRGHWAIGELEFYADPDCEGPKHPTLKKDDKFPDLTKDEPVLSPMHTTYGWQDDTPYMTEDDIPFDMQVDAPWYSEMRAIDGCYSSEFWSSCYQCWNPYVRLHDIKITPSAWYGVTFLNDDPDVTQIKCVKIFQKDADAYTATHVELQRWGPTGRPTETGWEFGWVQKGNWTGLNGGRWFILKQNATVAVAGAPGSAMPSLVLGFFVFLLWAGL